MLSNILPSYTLILKLSTTTTYINEFRARLGRALHLTEELILVTNKTLYLWTTRMGICIFTQIDLSTKTSSWCCYKSWTLIFLYANRRIWRSSGNTTHLLQKSLSIWDSCLEEEKNKYIFFLAPGTNGWYSFERLIIELDYTKSDKVDPPSYVRSQDITTLAHPISFNAS
ncbi:hypothetical protein BC941DRAFT_476230 [Chlamydoabsidia padenii]|nr:hypothetical protein BC941DRAFT_476230 [Chlamydoabsidia padenii]